VGFIKDEKVKIRRFLSGIPSFYKENIQYDETRALKGPSRRIITYMSKAREKNPC
jgi:hypothetical protein